MYNGVISQPQACLVLFFDGLMLRMLRIVSYRIKILSVLVATLLNPTFHLTRAGKELPRGSAVYSNSRIMAKEVACNF